jgi:hypothetical protein
MKQQTEIKKKMYNILLQKKKKVKLYIPLHGDLNSTQLEMASFHEREMHREKEGLLERQMQALVSWLR